MNVNHLHLRVRSRPVAEEFYVRHFGFRRSVEDGEILFLRDAAGLDLALAPCDQVEPLPPWFHFGFRLASDDAVARLHDQLVQAGVEITEALTRELDLTYFRCADPEGYQIEVYWEPEPTRRGPQQ